jgi:hypothetical protein
MTKPKYPKFKNKKFINRKFLNKDEGLAAIQTYVCVDSDSISGSVDISDCNRKVSLDFYTYDTKPKSVQDKLKKLDTLINALELFKINYVLGVQEIEKRRPAIEKYRKEIKEWNKLNNKEDSILDYL